MSLRQTNTVELCRTLTVLSVKMVGISDLDETVRIIPRRITGKKSGCKSDESFCLFVRMRPLAPDLGVSLLSAVTYMTEDGEKHARESQNGQGKHHLGISIPTRCSEGSSESCRGHSSGEPPIATACQLTSRRGGEMQLRTISFSV